MLCILKKNQLIFNYSVYQKVAPGGLKSELKIKF